METIRVGIKKSIAEKKELIASLQNQIKGQEEILHKLNSRTPPKPGSYADKAREALEAAGRPLHITEILTAIGKPDNNNNRCSFHGSLSHYVLKGVIFTRPGPNTFGLVSFPQLANGTLKEGREKLSN
jgi:hypothetical protein